MTRAGPGRILIEISLNIPPDSQLADAIRWLDTLPQHDEVRLECEAFLYMTIARATWRDADRARELRRQQEARQAAKAAKSP